MKRTGDDQEASVAKESRITILRSIKNFTVLLLPSTTITRTLEDEDEEMDFDSYLWEVVEKTVEVEPRSTFLPEKKGTEMQIEIECTSESDTKITETKATPMNLRISDAHAYAARSERRPAASSKKKTYGINQEEDRRRRDVLNKSSCSFGRRSSSVVLHGLRFAILPSRFFSCERGSSRGPRSMSTAGSFRSRSQLCIQ